VHAVPERVDGLCGWTSYKSAKATGCIDALSIDIELSNACGDVSSATLDTDMRHEIGHAMGFVHSEFREDLMFHASPAGLNKARDLSVEEMIDVTTVYGGVQ
jgi:predicted Zn-dependent protease